MSFNLNQSNKGWEAGYFLAHEECTRKTYQMAQNGAYVSTRADGAKYVPAGTVYPSNDGNAVGIVYEDVDVSTGNMPGSVVVAGQVIESLLPASVESTAKAVLKEIAFVTAPSGVNRPY